MPKCPDIETCREKVPLSLFRLFCLRDYFNCPTYKRRHEEKKLPSEWLREVEG